MSYCRFACELALHFTSWTETNCARLLSTDAELMVYAMSCYVTMGQYRVSILYLFVGVSSIYDFLYYLL